MPYAIVASFTGAEKVTRKIAGTWYDLYVFKVNGSITWAAPGDVDYVLVGGGGGGGARDFANGAGGGGGGEVLEGVVARVAGTDTITIGAGGLGGIAHGGSIDPLVVNRTPTEGGSSIFAGLTAIGGGRGANTAAGASGPATTGSSGGGGVSDFPTGAPGTAGKGFAGGDATSSGGGGGGGAGSAGTTPLATFHGAIGGRGKIINILDFPLELAGGGGGSAYDGSFPKGQARGGGGPSFGDRRRASPGVANTGGGGGGSAQGLTNALFVAGNGASGVAILRVATPLLEIPDLTIPRPYLDLPSDIGGGSDAWDDGAVGVILRSEWFAEELPTTYAVSVSESISATDQTDATAAPSGSVVTEAGTATDAQAAALVRAGSVTEAGTATDAQAAALVRAGTVTEAGTATDAQAAALVHAGTVTEAGTAADTVSAGAGSIPASAMEAGAATDAQAAALVHAGTVTEAGTATDAQGAILTRAGTVIEAATPTDSATASHTPIGLVSEIVVSTDLVETYLIRTGSIVEAVAAIDVTDADVLPPGFEYPSVDLSARHVAPLQSGAVRLTKASSARYDQIETGTVTR